MIRPTIVERWVSTDDAARWAQGTLAARSHWIHDFGGEQFTLGRAFYTHFEEDRTDAYFRAARDSDTLVETHAPGLQRHLRELVAKLTGGHVVPRRGWCGPGIHIFPPRGPVARKGGAVHFDVEGLGQRHREFRAPTLTVVVFLQCPERGGGLRLWNAHYTGSEYPSEADLGSQGLLIDPEPGLVVAFDSYRLHQIQPFSGERERISATVHAIETDPGRWETWF